MGKCLHWLCGQLSLLVPVITIFPRSKFLSLCYFAMKFVKANRIATDGCNIFAASHLGLFCLHMSHKKGAVFIWNMPGSKKNSRRVGGGASDPNPGWVKPQTGGGVPQSLKLQKDIFWKIEVVPDPTTSGSVHVNKKSHTKKNPVS